MQTFDRRHGFPLLTAIACAACVVIFLAINFQGDQSVAALRKWGLYSDADIFRGAYWALVTHAFVHVAPVHLLFNLFWLWAIGGAFEQRFGPLLWTAFVLCSAFMSSGIQLYSGSAGIGMSGVGYALFGFGWMTRSRIPEFARIVNDQTVLMFIGWGLLSIVTTYMGVMNIANLAHGAGFVFGAGLGMAYASKEGRIWPVAAVAGLCAVSLVPLFYNPKSPDWIANKASKAFRARNWAEAERWYRHGLESGAEPTWAWYNLALVYGQQGERQKLEDALSHLEKVDPEGAKELRELFGTEKEAATPPSITGSEDQGSRTTP
jgi:GlpG protein